MIQTHVQLYIVFSMLMIMITFGFNEQLMPLFPWNQGMIQRIPLVLVWRCQEGSVIMWLCAMITCWQWRQTFSGWRKQQQYNQKSWRCNQMNKALQILSPHVPWNLNISLNCPYLTYLPTYWLVCVLRSRLLSNCLTNSPVTIYVPFSPKCIFSFVGFFCFFICL